jgi:hypothetical protein
MTRQKIPMFIKTGMFHFWVLPAHGGAGVSRYCRIDPPPLPAYPFQMGHMPLKKCCAQAFDAIFAMVCLG